MKFELSTENIREAINESVRQQVNLKEGQEIQITFTNGRGQKGVTASVEIVAAGSQQAAQAGSDKTATTGAAEGTEAQTGTVERRNGRPVETATTADATEGDQPAPQAEGEGAKPGLFGTL